MLSDVARACLPYLDISKMVSFSCPPALPVFHAASSPDRSGFSSLPQMQFRHPSGWPELATECKNSLRRLNECRGRPCPSLFPQDKARLPSTLRETASLSDLLSEAQEASSCITTQTCLQNSTCGCDLFVNMSFEESGFF